MFSEKNIVITIGNHGAVVAVHEGSNIKNKIFLDGLNDDTQKHLRDVFAKNKSATVYVLLDTIDQSYKRKTYPFVRKSDLIQIVKRDLNNDGDKDSLKSYIILNDKKTKTDQINRRWECLFVSAPISETLNNWLEFLLNMPNRLAGIYMLPIESFNLFTLLQGVQNKVRPRSPVQKENICCLVIHTKVSGIRQIVFSQRGIIFTRVVDYHFDQPNFLEKYEHDIYSTFEYLKRLFPDLTMSEFSIVNILSSEAIEKISTINNIELKFENYTPSKAAIELGYPKLLTPNSNFCDLLISKIFSDKKKLLKFGTAKIKILEKFFLTLRTSYYLNLILVLSICASIVYTIVSQEKISEAVEIAEINKFETIQNLAKLKKMALDGADISEENSDITLERVVDLGRTEELLGKAGADFSQFYNNLKFLKSYRVKLDKVAYRMSGFNAKAPSSIADYELEFGGQIINKSGDIEDLFREFDSLVNEVRKNMPGKTVRYNELPRNIDFNKKYYSFPIDFTISNKQ